MAVLALSSGTKQQRARLAPLQLRYCSVADYRLMMNYNENVSRLYCVNLNEISSFSSKKTKF